MCEHCGQLEYAAELSTNKWLSAERNAEELSTALAEARLKLAKHDAVMAEVVMLVKRAHDGSGFPVRGVLDQILSVAGAGDEQAKAG
ncbi:MAG: hypothetical protein RLP44_02425 [Aggregatilineales bacterium]